MGFPFSADRRLFLSNQGINQEIGDMFVGRATRAGPDPCSNRFATRLQLGFVLLCRMSEKENVNTHTHTHTHTHTQCKLIRRRLY